MPRAFSSGSREWHGRYDAAFDLAGIEEAIEAVAGACGWSTLDLSPDDYRAIQTCLNAGGFNGAPDGVWGNGSRNAMRAFQEQNGLLITGAPIAQPSRHWASSPANSNLAHTALAQNPPCLVAVANRPPQGFSVHCRMIRLCLVTFSQNRVRLMRCLLGFLLFWFAAVPQAHADRLTGVASVIDGDTLEIRGQRIRLHGIDAPESRQLCATAEGQRWRCGQRAALSLAEGSAAGRSVAPFAIPTAMAASLRRHQDGTDLNGWRVREGWAWLDRRQPRLHPR